MRDKKEFYSILNQIADEPIVQYTRLSGDFDFNRYVLKINFVQDHPQTGPTLFVVRVPQLISGFPEELFNNAVRRTALEDFLVRRVSECIEGMARFDECGNARRRFSIADLGQKILPRSSVIVTEEYVEARLYANLPCRSEVIPADAIQDLFFEDLPTIVNTSLIYCNLDEEEVNTTVGLMEDTDEIRQMLPTRGLVSFLGEHVMLSRLLDSDEPDYVANKQLEVGAECRIDIEVPNMQSVPGVGIPAGITVILGDNYSGRAELTSAISAGIYNHVIGDGRELAVTVPDAVSICTEPGRSIKNVDISAFVGASAIGGDPRSFSAVSADAFTSQAAATVEALEVGARVLIYDEATSCSAFLSGDSRLRPLLGGNQSAIPLVARARQLADELGVSMIIGGETCAAEFIPIADTVLRMNQYGIQDVTKEAKQLLGDLEITSAPPVNIAALADKMRWIVSSSMDPSMGREDDYIHAPTVNLLEFGRSIIDLSAVVQLADVQQTETIGHILYYAKLRYMDESRPLRELLDLVDRDLSTEGLECLARDLRGDLARPRRYEIAAALNRLDSLRVQSNRS